ncbi:MAG TPA: phosphatidylserine decarboxylase [Candidatus Baltobacteraceae bacterium]|nr:phosphatidylserine decarboxylase [Candidatus Baltobacteraceae bacterium]
MKHSGKALFAGLKLIGLALAAVLVLLGVAWLVAHIGAFILEFYGVLFGLWLLFTLFTLYFFRDPEPLTPTGPNLVIAPGHGKVDVIDTTTENDFIGGECRRISIFLSVFDIHVQNSPVTGRIAFFKHTPGEYLNAMRTDCAQFNENVLIGIDSFEPRGEKIGVRLIAGLIARRIIPWIQDNDPVQRGERISLIQFGSRVDVYLPKSAKIKVQLGDRVVGGETVIASFN